MSGPTLNPRQDGLPLNWTRTGVFIVRENTVPVGPPREVYCLKGVTVNSNPQGDPLTQDLCYFVDDGTEVNLSATAGAGNFTIVTPVATPGGRNVANNTVAGQLTAAPFNIPRFVRGLHFRKGGAATVTIDFEAGPTTNTLDIVNPGTFTIGNGDGAQFIDVDGIFVTTGVDSDLHIYFEE